MLVDISLKSKTHPRKRVGTSGIVSKPKESSEGSCVEAKSHYGKY